MKTEKSEKPESSRSLIWAILILFVVGWLAWLLLMYAGSRPSFAEPVTEDSIKSTLAESGLHVCDRNTLSLDNTPGLESAKSLTLSTNCDNSSVTPMKVALLEFSDQASRDAAMQRANTTTRSGSAGALVYSYGPYVLVIQGPRTIALQTLFDKAMSEAGANQ